MLQKTDIPFYQFWAGVDLLINHLNLSHRNVYIFSADKLFYTVCVHKLYTLQMVDDFTIYGSNDDSVFEIMAQEECKTFTRKKGTIQIKPIQGNLCTMKRPTLVMLYDADSWTDEDWEDFYYCKMEKFLDNGASVVKVGKLNGQNP
jgi:hypothetical protein